MKRKFTKWHKKGLGAVFAFAVTLCTGLLASGQTAYASTIYTDTESNNSHEEAQIISKNAQTASQAVSGSTSVYRYVTGTLSYDDEDWYKVCDGNMEVRETINCLESRSIHLLYQKVLKLFMEDTDEQ